MAEFNNYANPTRHRFQPAIFVDFSKRFAGFVTLSLSNDRSIAFFNANWYHGNAPVRLLYPTIGNARISFFRRQAASNIHHGRKHFSGRYSFIRRFSYGHHRSAH